ncbi:hypothetical protein ACFU7Y_44150 [Kitasatospora sp. NPDC057542]|uniref:hypothetical protein n=1 Tax=Streptomycetaceae TaxID=2062 RepID=UPI0035A8A15E
MVWAKADGAFPSAEVCADVAHWAEENHKVLVFTDDGTTLDYRADRESSFGNELAKVFLMPATPACAGPTRSGSSPGVAATEGEIAGAVSWCEWARAERCRRPGGWFWESTSAVCRSVSAEVERCGDGRVVRPPLGVGGSAFDVGLDSLIGEILSGYE